jgi:hypothetical protein
MLLCGLGLAIPRQVGYDGKPGRTWIVWPDWVAGGVDDSGPGKLTLRYPFLQAEVRPELALAILERKFPQRWAKVTVVAAPPHHLSEPRDLQVLAQPSQDGMG